MGNADLAFEVAAGIALAACAGLRAFLPLLMLGVAGRLEWIALGESYRWLASWPALVIFGVAVVVEILSDKIPFVDHALDLVGGVVKPAAGALLAASVLADLTPLQAAVAGILAGGGTAGLVHVLKAKVRLFSSITTAGLGNPFLSVAEDLASFFGSLVAIVIPALLLAVLAATIVAFFFVRHRFRARAARLAP